MKSVFIQYKPFFLFLFKFLAFYIVFTVVYKLYLNQYDENQYEVDGITKNVAIYSARLLNMFGEEAYTYPNEMGNYMSFLVSNKYVSRVVEGCNAISVIILFAAFVFAFSNTFKRTFVFILAGSIIIYLLNILRIALLNYAFYYYPQYNDFLHDILFPLFIYGVVFVLWIVWITKFSGYEKNTKT